MEFSRQEYWNGLPFPTPGDLPNPGIEPADLASPTLAGRYFTTYTLPPERLMLSINCYLLNLHSVFRSLTA